MHVAPTLILLFSIATAVAIAAHRLRVPYTVLLVVTGLLLGALHAFEAPHLTKELLFAVFLPGLLFEAAFHVDFGEFRQNRKAISALAVPGVIAAIGLTAVLLVSAAQFLRFPEGFGWAPALIFGAIIAATDPIAVVALFKSLGAPRRLGILVEGESLLNDGTSIVFFTLVLSAVTGGAFTLSGLIIDFALVVGVGAIVGVAVGLAVSHVIRRVNEPMIEITLTTIAAYGSFVAAEELHYSGVIATVVAGMICGNYAARTGMSPTTRIAVETFWEYIAFALNSLVFLLIGFEVSLSRLAESWLAILAAWVAVVAGRAIVVAIVHSVLRPTRERLPKNWATALTWGGLKGALSMVLALSLPLTFPFRDLVITLTFGVVILSILVQGITMAPLMRRLGLARSRDAHERYERARGELRTVAGALAALDAMARGHFAHADAATTVRAEYEARAAAARETIDELHLSQHDLRAEDARQLRRHLLHVERDEAVRAYRTGQLGQHALDAALADVDLRLVALDTEGSDQPPPPSAAPSEQPA